MKKIFVVVLSYTIFCYVWIQFVSPHILKIPSDFGYSADVISKDNFYDEKIGDFKGTQVSDTKFFYEVTEQRNGNLVIKNVFDVRTTSGEKIFSVERLYGINTVSGQHINNLGDRDRQGYLFAPRRLNKNPFTYWHINYDEPANLKFVAEESVAGLKVFKYEANYQADQTQDLTQLPEVGKSKGINLDINLQVWIEPISGWMVKYQDQTTAYYYDLTSKERLNPWNKFTNTYSEDSIREHVRIAKAEKYKINLVQIVVPVVIGVVILMLLLLSFHVPMLQNIFFFILFLTPILFTFSLRNIAQQNINQQLQTKFDIESKALEVEILNRIETYKNGLSGGAGLFLASEKVEAGEWKKYVDGVNLLKNYPGIKAMSYVGYTKTAAPIIYIEPQTLENVAVLGFNLLSEEKRKNALEKSLDSGLPTLTGKIVLEQDKLLNRDPVGFLMLLPFYKDSSTTGFITAPFHMTDFMLGILSTANTDSTVGFEIYDGNEATSSSKMYGSIDSFSKFQKTKTIYPLGYPWTIKFATLDGFGLNSSEEQFPTFVMIGGLIFSGLLFVIFFILINSRTRAVTYATKLTADLVLEKSKLELAKQDSDQRANEAERMNKIMVDRELKIIELKNRLAALENNPTTT